MVEEGLSRKRDKGKVVKDKDNCPIPKSAKIWAIVALQLRAVGRYSRVHR